MKTGSPEHLLPFHHGTRQFTPNLDGSLSASAASILPSLDGSFSLNNRQPDSREISRLRRLSSEADPARKNEASHFDRSRNSSAEVSANAKDRFASLAHLVSIMNPHGLEPRARTANHDAIIHHFQLRRVSGEASRASYARKEDDADEESSKKVDSDAPFSTEGSLSKIFAQRRILNLQMRAKSHRDSLHDLSRNKINEVEVSRGALCRGLVALGLFARRSCRQAMLDCLAPFSPTGKVAHARGVVMTLITLSQVFTAPFTTVYLPEGSPVTTSLSVIFDVAFLVDLFINFNTAYNDEKVNRLELSRRKIFKRFILQRRKPWIALDVFAAIPLDIGLVLASANNRLPTQVKPGSHVLAFEGSRALLRVVQRHSLLPHTIWGVRVLRVAKQLPWRLILQRHNVSLHFAQTILVLVFVVHAVACMWRATLMSSSEDVKHDRGLEDPWAHYLVDLVIAAQLLSGHLVPSVLLSESVHASPHLSVFNAITMLVGAVLMAYVFSCVALLLLEKNANASRYNAKLSGVFATMEKLQLPRSLRQRIHQYYDHLWAQHDATETGEIAAFSKALSPSLGLEVNLFKYMDLVLSVPFWRNCSADFITQIMLNLQVSTYLPEDYVMRQGEIGDVLFVVNRGICELRARVDEDGRTQLPQPRVRRLNPGAAFGELALLMNYRRTATVRALTFVELCILGRKAFQKILTRYRDDRREVLREILLSCIEKKTQRFVPFPYEELVEKAVGVQNLKAPTPWEAAEVLVDLISAPDCTDDSVIFGFRDFDFVSQHRLVPVGTNLTASHQPSTLSHDEIAARLSSLEQWQVATSDRLAAMEGGVQSILQELTRLRETLSLSHPG